MLFSGVGPVKMSNLVIDDDLDMGEFVIIGGVSLSAVVVDSDLDMGAHTIKNGMLMSDVEKNIPVTVSW